MSSYRKGTITFFLKQSDHSAGRYTSLAIYAMTMWCLSHRMKALYIRHTSKFMVKTVKISQCMAVLLEQFKVSCIFIMLGRLINSM